MLENWLACYFCKGVGNKKFYNYIKEDATLKSITPEIKPDWSFVDKLLKWREDPVNHILTLNDAEYPRLLRHIVEPPPVIFVKGDLAVLQQQQIAIVGARKATKSGLMHAKNFAMELAARGLVITSGLANGIDTAAHHGALFVAGKTVGVLGSGIDNIYPTANKKLANKIISDGTLVSEFPSDMPPKSYNFPRRNRIISGLSLGVLVVEAELKSGSLISALHALEQNREVFAIPGDISNRYVVGCHKLIKEGAKLVETVDDIIEELSMQGVASIAANSADDIAPATLTNHQRGILSIIDNGPVLLSDVVDKSGLEWGETCASLQELELSGYISSTTEGYIKDTGFGILPNAS